MDPLAAPASRSPSRPRRSAVRVLVVEDDEAQRTALTAALDARGMEPVPASTGAEAFEVLAHDAPDVVVLDLGLPDIDGLDLCRHVHALTSAPVVVVTAEVDEARVLEAFARGAVDYVTKPYSTPVLVARLTVAIEAADAARRAHPGGVLTCGDLAIDVDAHAARIGTRALTLTARQFDLLAVLTRESGRLLTYAAIQRQLWGPADRGDRVPAIRNVVSALRAQLGGAPTSPQIDTEGGLGYRLRPPA